MSVAMFCNCFGIFVVLLSVLIGYVNQEFLFEWAVKRSFSQYEHGTLCLSYNDRPSLAMERYGLSSNSNSVCDAKMIINNSNEFFRMVATGGGSIGLGEAYFEGMWDVESSDSEALSTVLFHIMWNTVTADSNNKPFQWVASRFMEYKVFFHWLQRLFTESKTMELDANDIEYHYDKGYSFDYDITTEFWESYLGPTRSGSCAIWDDTHNTLELAQDNKWEIIINKLRVSASDSVLDVGSGWGYLCSKLNNDTNGNCTGITLSKDQLAASKEKWHSQLCNVRDKDEIKTKGCIKFILLDYRDSMKEFGEETFDKIVSVGMVEHVGFARIEEYFYVLSKVLKKGGKMLIHGITIDDVWPNFKPVNRKTMCTNSNFISKYIFPGGCILHPDFMIEAAFKANLSILHRENYGKHYARTLNAWLHNMRRNWPNLKNKGNLDQRFFKLHEFYFSICEAGFRASRVELTHFLFTRPKTANGKDYDATFYLRNDIINPNIPSNRCYQ